MHLWLTSGLHIHMYPSIHIFVPKFACLLTYAHAQTILRYLYVSPLMTDKIMSIVWFNLICKFFWIYSEAVWRDMFLFEEGGRQEEGKERGKVGGREGIKERTHLENCAFSTFYWLYSCLPTRISDFVYCSAESSESFLIFVYEVRRLNLCFL